MDMKLIDIIKEGKLNPIEDYFDSKAPYHRNNRVLSNTLIIRMNISNPSILY